MTRRGSEAGFSLVVLMGAITIMLIAMGVAAPTWEHVMQDDREQELLYRGGAIADAIARYQKKNGGTLPVSLDVLVKGRFLRRAYKDPMMANGQWRFIRQGEAVGPTTQVPARPGMPSPSPLPSPNAGGLTGMSGGPLGGFVGVASRSAKPSLRLLNNAKTYDTWLFIAGRPRIVGKQPAVAALGAPGAPGAPGALGATPTGPRPSTPPGQP